MFTFNPLETSILTEMVIRVIKVIIVITLMTLMTLVSETEHHAEVHTTGLCEIVGIAHYP